MVRARHLAAAALALTAAACMSPVPLVCTDLLPFHGLIIDIDGADADGVYTVIARADGQELVIDVDRSINNDGCTIDGVRGPCSRQAGTGPRAVTLDVDVFPSIRVGYVDGELGGPDTITLEVRYAGFSATRTYTPAYEAAEPNGDGCGVIRRAHDRLAFTPPMP